MGVDGVGAQRVVSVDKTGPVHELLSELRDLPRRGDPWGSGHRGLRPHRARGEGIESIEQIKWCVLDTSGNMSFIKNDHA